MQKLLNNADLKKLAQSIQVDTNENKEILLASLEDELKNKIKSKGKLSIEEQIIYMQAKGISFKYVNEHDAKLYLAENSYYYKVTAYRSNFPKNKDGHYIDLDFANLKDLAVIDMHLRYLVLKLSLDIEHTLKTLILNLITDDPGEDGYQIIEDFNNYEFNNYTKQGKPSTEYKHIKDKILREINHKRDYNYDFYMTSKTNISIWKLVEIMTYGHLISFIKFYVNTSRHKSKKLKKAANLLPFAKNIRDAAAHSRPILLNVTEENQFKPSVAFKNDIISKGIDSRLVSTTLTNYRIHDLCALLILHDEYIHGKYMRKSRKHELFSVYKRSLYRRSIYRNDYFNNILTLLYNIIKKYKVNY